MRKAPRGTPGGALIFFYLQSYATRNSQYQNNRQNYPAHLTFRYEQSTLLQRPFFLFKLFNVPFYIIHFSCFSVMTLSIFIVAKSCIFRHLPQLSQTLFGSRSHISHSRQPMQSLSYSTHFCVSIVPALPMF